ncbi:glycerophosphodiester phosphodiesterase family protein [Thermosipho atlanticus]|uniref:Glycerophosphoryl diester phosphodiesterase n=1 Tax=Thermosipho atlanticus DSM 15807 TaxID=1123380 RepID=A0A1M5QWR5_9BACT|nr:glycerophosphodiester phosphodiesterase family protein [Thermosipho atlanticus]SHH18594.1 glycerophosphoryl diester phosphodiesterase [Thermosipho atlanticus DSM 15807]
MKNYFLILFLVGIILSNLLLPDKYKRLIILEEYEQELKILKNEHNKKSEVKNVYILGHRGYPKKYVENTLESFKGAIEAGADGVELDIWKSKDGIIMVSHDNSLERVFRVDLSIKSSTASEIKNKAPVPTLEEVFNIIPKGKIINIEIKDKEAGDAAVELVKEHDLSEYVIFSSFDHEIITELSKKYDNEKFGYLFDERHTYLTLNDLKKLFEPKNIYSAHIPIQLLVHDREMFLKLIELLRYLDKKIVLWTVNDGSIIKEFKPDYIITDEVEKLVNIFK